MLWATMTDYFVSLGRCPIPSDNIITALLPIDISHPEFQKLLFSKRCPALFSNRRFAPLIPDQRPFVAGLCRERQIRRITDVYFYCDD